MATVWGNEDVACYFTTKHSWRGKWVQLVLEPVITSGHIAFLVVRMSNCAWLLFCKWLLHCCLQIQEDIFHRDEGNNNLQPIESGGHQPGRNSDMRATSRDHLVRLCYILKRACITLMRLRLYTFYIQEELLYHLISLLTFSSHSFPLFFHYYQSVCRKWNDFSFTL